MAAIWLHNQDQNNDNTNRYANTDGGGNLKGSHYQTKTYK